jgi:beta-glucosidase
MLKVKQWAILLCAVAMTGSVASALTPAEIDALVASMTLDEKVGQMTQAERGTASPQDVRDYYLGSILSGGGSHPGSNTAAGWADMHDEYQDDALQTRLEIPILYGVDAVHGHSNVVGATIFPHNIGLGATRDPALVEEIGRITAREVRATGLEWTFAPCVAVVRDERWGRTYEGFGEHPELATMFGGVFVKGLQGTGSITGERVVACAKHFVGDGGTTGGDDQGNTVCTEQELRDIHMPGYTEAIANNVATIMPSYSSWNGLKMHENGYLMNDVLKTEFGFDGFLISDWHAVDQVSGANFYEDVVLAVNAGIDMGMQPNNWREWISNLKTAAGNGDIPMSRIDDAVRRILEIKNRGGLLDGVTANIYADPTLVNGGVLGAQAHRDVAREAVRKSLVLLKNDGVLPLSKDANIYVAGKNASDIGNQCGGWTISWQGSSGNITPGTTILEGIENEVAEGTGSVTFREDGRQSSGYDVAIVVIGETPYAEGNGDDTDLALDSADLNCLANIDPGVPTVVVLVSGRPMITTNEINNSNAFVAAWLPGTEGDGVAEVLFGDYDFTGKLPHSWPRNIQQVPINYGDANYDPLFAYGFGLDHGTVLPSVTITNPTNGSTVPTGNITITADASTTTGTVDRVEFYESLNYLGQDTTEPYSYTWNSVADGCYTIKAKVITDIGDENTDSVDITVGTGCGGGNTPYHGSPFVLPTRIEAEDYDLGGEGVAYHDVSGGNDGYTYNMTDYRINDDVDNQYCDEGGYNIGWLSDGEWLEYVVTVPTSGTYDIDIRVASQDTGGDFHIAFNGIDVTGNIHVDSTGGWQTWTTVSATATLTAGTQIMRFVNNSTSGQEYNINYFDFTAPMATVPDVVGMSQISGHSAIIAQGLTLGNITYVYSDTDGFDIIMTQSPSGGALVIAGSSVDTEISLGIRGDLDNNDSVDIEDLRIMAAEWLTPGIQADIGPVTGPADGGDGWVDLVDFTVLASDWLKSI